MGGAGLTSEPAPLTRLRPPRPPERRALLLWREQVQSEFEDFGGPPPPGVSATAALAAPEGGGDLAVVDQRDVLIGNIAWRPVTFGPNAGSTALEFGISLQPDARGRGHGTRAQRLLAAHLFATTPVHRVQASTDVDNVAEQTALERAGFRREGVLRGAQWRRGTWHDLVGYARLRTDPL